MSDTAQTVQDPERDLPAVMTAKQMAQLLRISERSVYEKARLGQLPHRRMGRQVRFYRDSVLEWLKGPATTRS